MPQRVAIIEDDTDLARLLASWLSSYGYESTLFVSAELFLDSLQKNHFDLLLVDWLLPGLTGLELVKILSKKEITTPTIFITGKAHADDLATALHSGADDFVSKPISRTILMARIHAVMRSRGLLKNGFNPNSSIELDSNNHDLIYMQQKLHLTALEFKLLQLLIQAGNSVVSRKELSDSLWEDDTKIEEGRALDLLISRLRKKLNTLAPIPGKLINRYGQGYTFERSDSTNSDSKTDN